jgi:pilus assembly protein Flp/PilA
MKNVIKTFLRDEDGAALVEYGLALLVVILVGTVALGALAEDTGTLFTGASTASGEAVTTAGLN